VVRGELRQAVRTFPWLLGTLIVLAVALPWYACAHWQSDGAFTAQFFLAENLGRYLANVNKHGLPFFIYLLLLVPMTFPWAAVLPLSIWSALKHAPWRGHHREAAAWLLAWQVVIVLALFTFSSTRVWTYTLTAFPPLAIFVGKWLAGVTAAGTEGRRALLGPLLLFALLASHASIASLLVPLDALPADVRSQELLWAVRAGLGALTALAWLLVLLARRAEPRTTVCALVAGVASIYLGAATWLMPVFDREFKQPVREVAGVVRAYPAARVITYFVHEHGLNFHGQVRHVGHWREGSLDDLHDLLASSEEVFILMPPERVAEFEGTDLRVWLSHRRFVLGANFSPADGPMASPYGELGYQAARPIP
jgi:4-amino-4-deoxy-L-arabinose transferase-like glycosyltransferase